jgi:hypothetical protein
MPHRVWTIRWRSDVHRTMVTSQSVDIEGEGQGLVEQDFRCFDATKIDETVAMRACGWHRKIRLWIWGPTASQTQLSGVSKTLRSEVMPMNINKSEPSSKWVVECWALSVDRMQMERYMMMGVWRWVVLIQLAHVCWLLKTRSHPSREPFWPIIENLHLLNSENIYLGVR